MPEHPITAREIVSDLEEVPSLDPLVVLNIRSGLGAIANQVRELDDVHGLGGHVDAVRRSEVLDLIDPSGGPA